MKLRQIQGSQFIPDNTRRYFEGASYFDLRNARYIVQHFMPNHVVFTEGDRLVIANRDRSIRLAEFRAVGDLKRSFPA
jgi:hypothetical protein